MLSICTATWRNGFQPSFALDSPAKQHGVPARRKRDALLVELPPWITPAQVHAQLGASGQRAQPKMQIGAAPSRMPVPAVYLCHEPSPVWQVDGSRGPNGCPSWRVPAGMADPHPQGSWLQRLEQMQADKGPYIWTLIVVERRAAPHIGDGEIQSAIPIHIRHRDPPTDLWFGEPQVGRQVIVPPIRTSHIERVVLVPADFGILLQYRKDPGIVYESF